MIEQLGGRKYMGFIIVTVLGFVLVLVKDLKTATDFMTFIFGIFTVFVAGNVASKKVTETK